MTRHIQKTSDKDTDLWGMSPFERFEKQFEKMLPKLLQRPFDWHWPGIPVITPKMDVIDDDKEIIVRAEIPGVNKDDLDVTITDHSVCLKAKTHREEKEEKKNYFRQEISHGEIYRSMLLPCQVDETKASASFRDGVFELTVPKLENAHQQKIEIH
ncbi:MAG: Hsp20/alpha crystallin family protein [Gammaproteobacteria bacterium]|nr:Hsp20/alpha crystallin family protein [Gammaproteobacteria bacterium]MCW9005039.1 Hsp20/alpha crystallin family protein [Gammaproteobacteria bacterium]MCW9056561.1 Hsp20/alpha crystallin family protein [Gammaproteobacteria bacterium]